MEGINSGWEQWYLLSSDRHHDNKACRRDLEKEHLDQMVEKDGYLFDFGDLFCAMQGKWDPRSDMSDIRPEDVTTNYLDTIVEHASDFYKPYAARILLLAKGNHERQIEKRRNTCLTSRLVQLLNAGKGVSVVQGHIGGWIQFRFQWNKTKTVTKNLYYHHGAGGGGPVTRGTIQTNRQAVYQPNAHIIVNGHTHDSWCLKIARATLSQRGIPGRDLVWFVRTPGYHDGYGDGGDSWENDTWKPIKPLGAAWLHFYLINNQIRTEIMETAE